jgi:hypothetical protein
MKNSSGPQRQDLEVNLLFYQRPGYLLETIKDAQARGYNIVVLSESTATADVATVEPSAAPKKRPTDPFIMLNEINVDKISDVERLKDFIYLCDAGLNFLDDEFALDAETRVFVNMPDADFIDEGLKHHHSSTARKIASAKRYRNRRQHILRKKREAERNAVAKVVAKKMALSRKTPKGKPKKENNVSEGLKREGLWNGAGTPYSEWMKPASQKNSKEMRAEVEKWLKATPKPHLVVECWNKEKKIIETIDADLFLVRAGREIRKLLEGVRE